MCRCDTRVSCYVECNVQDGVIDTVLGEGAVHRIADGTEFLATDGSGRVAQCSVDRGIKVHACGKCEQVACTA